MNVAFDPTSAGQVDANQGTFDDTDVTFFNTALHGPISQADSETADTSNLHDLFNLSSSSGTQAPSGYGNIDQAPITMEGPWDSTWRVDQENLTCYLDNGYQIVFEQELIGSKFHEEWQIIDDEGNVTHISGLHVHESDGGKWDFGADMSFVLADGTKITFQTKTHDYYPDVTVIDSLIITKGDNCIQVTGLGSNQFTISEVTYNGRQIDADTFDGYVLTEKGGTDDWILTSCEEFTQNVPSEYQNFGDEVMHNLPFVDYETYCYAIHNSIFANYFLPVSIDLSGHYTAETVDQRFDDLEAVLAFFLSGYQQGLDYTQKISDRSFIRDYIDAFTGDLHSLRDHRNKGSLLERAQFFNNLRTEVLLELKYNIVLTHDLAPVWSGQDLEALQTELEKMPLDFSLFNPELSNLSFAKLPNRVSATNRGSDGIVFNINYDDTVGRSAIHEIGHYYDQYDYDGYENPRIKEFMAISGWCDFTSRFTEISSDYDDTGYIPYDGHAIFDKDGQVYHDGDVIDLDGDPNNVGKHGIVQVQYGKVFIHSFSATFAEDYGSVAPIEDFATTFENFFNDHSNLQSNSPEKYAFMLEYTGYDPYSNMTT